MNTLDIIPDRQVLMLVFLCLIFGFNMGVAFGSISMGIACFVGLFTPIVAIVFIVQGIEHRIRTHITELPAATPEN